MNIKEEPEEVLKSCNNIPGTSPTNQAFIIPLNTIKEEFIDGSYSCISEDISLQYIKSEDDISESNNEEKTISSIKLEKIQNDTEWSHSGTSTIKMDLSLDLPKTKIEVHFEETAAICHGLSAADVVSHIKQETSDDFEECCYGEGGSGNQVFNTNNVTIETVTKDKTFNIFKKSIHDTDIDEIDVKKEVLNIKQASETRVKIFKCTLCAYDCRNLSDLKRHSAVHLKEKPFKCSECALKFRTSISLTKHEMVHSEKKAYKCHVCEYTCDRSAELVNHKLVHIKDKQSIHKVIEFNEKQLTCFHCDFECSTSEDLKKHKIIHTKEQNCLTNSGKQTFKCTVCEFKCIKYRNLKKHTMIHSADRPLKCEFCDYKCMQMYSFRRHKLLHTARDSKPV